MIDTKALKLAIISHDLTQKEVAKHLGIAPKTFYAKMKKGVFGSDEMEGMIKLLAIDKPCEIFFAKEVTS